MAKKIITLDPGIVTVPICDLEGNEISSFSFLPSDPGLLTKLANVKRRAEKLDETLGRFSDSDDIEECGDWVARAEQEVKGLFGELIGDDAADLLLQNIAPLALVGGTYVFETLFEGMVEIAEEAMAEENKKRADRLAQYTKDYDRPSA